MKHIKTYEGFINKIKKFDPINVMSYSIGFMMKMTINERRRKIKKASKKLGLEYYLEDYGMYVGKGSYLWVNCEDNFSISKTEFNTSMAIPRNHSKDKEKYHNGLEYVDNSGKEFNTINDIIKYIKTFDFEKYYKDFKFKEDSENMGLL